MENREQEIFFRLIASAVSACPLGAEERALYDPALLPEMTALARHHDLAHLLVLGLKNNGLLREKDNALESEIFRAVLRYEQLHYELTRLCETLEGARIPFLPLKGAVLRRYYPEPWMRTSCDMDVLVHEEDLNRATAALAERLGYRIGKKGGHDVQIFTQNGQHIELHFHLIEDGYAQRASEVLGTVWDTAVPCSGWTYRREMPDEMFYFYHIAHMAKHVENGGCGIRPFLDIWILNHRAAFERERREALTADGGLSTFARQAERLAELWFGTGARDAAVSHLEQYILRGGVYGSLTNRVSVQQVMRGGKLRYACSRIWLPYETLKVHYPSLDGKPGRLPLYEVRRWGKLLFCGGAARSVNELRVNGSISEERSDEARTLLSELGLDAKK